MLNANFLFFINVVVGPSLSRIRHLRPEMVAVTIETCSPSLVSESVAPSFYIRQIDLQ